MLSSATDVPMSSLDPSAVQTAPMNLAMVGKGQFARVREVRLPKLGHGHDTNLVLRLLEIGFVPGELVRVVALGPGGREPIAVRLGGTMFALRQHEAEHILVDLQGAQP